MLRRGYATANGARRRPVRSRETAIGPEGGRLLQRPHPDGARERVCIVDSPNCASTSVCPRDFWEIYVEASWLRSPSSAPEPRSCHRPDSHTSLCHRLAPPWALPRPWLSSPSPAAAAAARPRRQPPVAPHFGSENALLGAVGLPSAAAAAGGACCRGCASGSCPPPDAGGSAAVAEEDASSLAATAPVAPGGGAGPPWSP